MKNPLLLILFCILPLQGFAQRPVYDKLSPMLRKIVRESQRTHEAPGRVGITAEGDTALSLKKPQKYHSPNTVCAFVKIGDGGEDVLRREGCRLLAQEGDICIANIPIESIGTLSADRRIKRIEANRNTQPLTDSLAWYLNALPVYEGRDLPQAFTGKGVVVGVMDIGFDLTHPNFYSRDTTEYRISAFWDMLSADTVGSAFPVGRDYVGRDEILAVAHARDGLDQTHGTHTLGIAAGSGYDSPYRGMAPEADICLVANAVTSDSVYIAPDDYYKYTFATDALGFKYMFDYARSQGRPCVVSFSEGSKQDFWGYDLLYYEMLSRLTGPGCIIVSAAGNNGNDKTWFRKAKGVETDGSFFTSNTPSGMLTMKSAEDFDLRLVAYDTTGNDTLVVSTRDVLQMADSVFSSTIYSKYDSVGVLIEAYPSCYNADETCYDVTLTGTKRVGGSPRLSFEVMGIEADIDVYLMSGNLIEHNLNPMLTAGERNHSILSPASSPDIICVGATYYRLGIINYMGEWRRSGKGIYGEWGAYSSVGPTYDERIKPDVLAPGSNIISSYSSYYLENHPNAPDIGWDVAHFDFNGRTYAWNSNSGTSMSCPAVAGAIALWMQAKPDLTTEEVLDVFKHTCRHYDDKLTYPNNYYGYGEIDVYHGLLYLLGVDGIEGVSTSQSKARIACRDGRMTIDFGSPLSSEVTIRLFSLNGRQVFSTTQPAGSTMFNSCNLPYSLSNLPAAVYVLQIDGDPQVAGSSLIRL